ncbi:MAG: low-specificity L-threonine aldolase [Pseudomonadota bacterium]
MSYYGATQGPGGPVDLRSDTVTRPDAAMRAAMAAAEVGDDVYGDDPTVARLEADLAARFGMAAGLLLPTGTQSNLVAVLCHCGRGDEVLVGRGYHVECAEARGTSVLGGVAVEPLELRDDAGIDPATVAAAVKPDDVHCPVTRLLSLENTVGGRVVPLEVQAAAVAEGRRHGLAVHLDGARVFNACVALDVTPAEMAAGFDTVSICLSKGLGTPAGSVLVGPADLIDRARRWRKMLGGGMRQAGVIAAAGLHALAHHVPELARDHGRAARLRDGLTGLPGLAVDQAPGQTNMVWLRFDADRAAILRDILADHGVTVAPGAGSLRMVLHRDVDDAGIDAALAGFRAYADGAAAA